MTDSPSSTGQIQSYRPSGAVASSVKWRHATPPPIYAGWLNLTSTVPVRSIVVEPMEGVFWLATLGGVVRVERTPKTSTLYTSEHGLPGNSALSVVLDREGRLWAAFEEGGLAYYEGDSWRLYERGFPLPDGCPASPVQAMTAAETGIWVSTAYGVYRIESPETAALPIALYPAVGAMNAHALLDDGDTLLVGTTLGLFRLSPTGCEPLEAETFDGPVALARDFLGRIWVASAARLYRLKGNEAVSVVPLTGSSPVRAMAWGQRRLWLLTSQGIWIWQEGNSVQLLDPPSPDLFAVAASSDGRYLWVAGQRGFGYVTVPSAVGSAAPRGVEWRLPWPEPRQPIGVTVLDCHALAGPDEQGRVWVGTANGLMVIRDETVLSAGLRTCVQTIGISDGQLWLHCSPLGIVMVESNKIPVDPDHPTPYQSYQQGLPGLPLRMALGGDGWPYCLTGQGLFRLGEVGEERWDRVAVGTPGGRLSYPTALVQGTDGRWWVGTDHGLYVYEFGAWRTRIPTVGQTWRINSLLATNGLLWIGSNRGLWRLKGEEWSSCEPASGGAGPVQALALAPGGLWVATPGGLLHLDPTTLMVQAGYGLRDSGLGSGRVRSLLATEGDLWVATEAGLSRFTFDSE